MKALSSLLTKREVASELGGVSVSFVNQLLASRILPKVRLSYRVCRIPREAVEKFILARTEVAR